MNGKMLALMIQTYKMITIVDDDGSDLTDFIDYFFMHFCPETITTHAESINSDLQHGLDRRLRRTTLNTEQKQLTIKIPADN